jgi:hypothetical protein
LGLGSNRLPVGRESSVMTSSRLSVSVAAFFGLLSMAAGLAMRNLVDGLVSSISSQFLAVGASS